MLIFFLLVVLSYYVFFEVLYFVFVVGWVFWKLLLWINLSERNLSYIFYDD